MLKNRVFNHTHGFNDELLEKIGMDVDLLEFGKLWVGLNLPMFPSWDPGI